MPKNVPSRGFSLVRTERSVHQLRRGNKRSVAGRGGRRPVCVHIPLYILKWPCFEIFRVESTSCANVLLKRRVTGRGVLDCMLYPQYAFISASSLLAREKGTNKSLGLAVFLVKQGNQPQPNWAI